jgi:hypothetical protein
MHHDLEKGVDLQHYSYIVAVMFIVGENWSTGRNPPTCRKSLTNFITVMVFNATFNNISVISWRSVLLILVEETGVPGENC